MKSAIVPAASWLARYERPWLRADVVAGLTTAAVVIPKAMAYATIAGLPVQVGLYTALVPMAVYAVLGTSRPLSVSTTTTLGILCASALGDAVPHAEPAALVTASSTLAVLVGRDPAARAPAAARLRRQLHLRARARRLQGGHRARDRARPGAQAAGRALRQARVGPRRGLARPPSAGDLDADAGRRLRDARGRRRPRAPGPAAARRRCWRSEAASRRPTTSGCRRRASRSSGTSRAACPRSSARSLSLAGGALARGRGDRAHELHRDDRGRARVRRARRAAARPEPGARRDRRVQPAGRPVRRHARRGRHVADGGEPEGRSAHAGRGPGDRGVSLWRRCCSWRRSWASSRRRRSPAS